MLHSHFCVLREQISFCPMTLWICLLYWIGYIFLVMMIWDIQIGLHGFSLLNFTNWIGMMTQLYDIVLVFVQLQWCIRHVAPTTVLWHAEPRSTIDVCWNGWSFVSKRRGSKPNNSSKLNVCDILLMKQSVSHCHGLLDKSIKICWLNSILVSTRIWMTFDG